MAERKRTAMHRSAASLRHCLTAATLLVALSSLPSLAADDPDAPRGAAVTVLKAAKSCFADIVDVSGIVIAREETAVRPERPGAKVAEIMAEPGDTVAAGQALARLTAADGSSVQVQAPVAGLISTSSAVVGARAAGKGGPPFSLIPRGGIELIGLGAGAG